MKKCSKCKEEKEFVEFAKDKTKKDGYRSICKICAKQYNNKRYEENKKYFKNYYKENKEKIIKKSKDYKNNNKEIVNKKRREYEKLKKQTNILYKLKTNIRSLVVGSFKRGKNQFSKKAKTEKILGCTIEEFMIYIESKFKEGMSFENQGKWHLDHIYPISLAKSEEEVIKLNHYTNFQPLWAEENFKKSNKIVNNYYLHLYQ